MSELLLRMRNINKSFGSVSALRGVNLELEPGARLAVVGPNGAGKSTLLRIIAGLSRATSGQIELCGGKPDRRGIGYLGHATFLYADLTARENLIFSARLQGVDHPEERADQLLLEEGLVESAHRRAGAFSRGMAQRLAIARARVHAPPLLLLDEPFTGLDGPASTRLIARLVAFRSEDQSLILITHELSQAAALCDRALLLSKGEVADRLDSTSFSEHGLRAAYQEVVQAPL